MKINTQNPSLSFSSSQYVQKPNVAHVRFLEAGDDARMEIAKLPISLDVRWIKRLS